MSVAPLRDAMEGVSVELERSDATVLLGAIADRGVSFQSVQGPFHAVPVAEGTLVRLRSTDTKTRIVTLTIATEDRRFRESWTRWTLPARLASAKLGGDSADAQDEAGARSTCRLLLLPGETREVVLGFEVPLDGNLPGDLPTRVEVADDAGCERLPLLLKLRHPQAGFLRQLPSVYGEAMLDLAQDSDDRTQPPFFERYLRGFEDTMEPLWAAIEHVERILGPYSTPAGFLPFLASWTAMPFEESLSEMGRRRYIAEAVALVRWRGTARGLRHLLRIVAGGDCRIDEASVDGMKLGGAMGTLGASGVKLGNVGAHFFRVTLTVPEPERLDVRAVHRAIAWCKPAHTVYELSVVGA